MQKNTIAALSLIAISLTLCLLQFVYVNMYFPRAKSIVDAIFHRTSLEEFKKCMPSTELKIILDNVRSGNGDRRQKQTKLIPIAAYEYEQYSVVTTKADGWFGQTVYCQYFDEDNQEIGEPLESVVFPEFVVHCCSRKNTVYMGITADRTSVVDKKIQVETRIGEPKYNLSLCLAPIYGDETKWLLLAETIEHYRVHGVEHFYLYVKDIDEYSNKLVKYYEQAGDATVTYFGAEQDRPGLEWQLAGVQDCVQRTKHESRYAIFADIDERITPSDSKSLAQYVSEKFSEDESRGSLQFRPRWILRRNSLPKIYEGNQTLEQFLPTLNYHNTSSWPNTAVHTAKCILDTLKVMTMGVHEVITYLPNSHTYEVPPEEAVVRHYRDVTAGDWETLWLEHVAVFGPFSNTTYPNEFMTPLLERLENVLNEVYLANSTSAP